MSDLSIPEFRISIDQLRPGVFIRLERLNWFNHPFLFSSFKVKDQGQIDVMRSLGITEVICIPEKSDRLPAQPGAAPDAETPAAAPAAAASAAVDELWRVKKERIARLQAKKQRIAECEEHFASSMKDVSRIIQGLGQGSDASVAEALEFVQRLTENFLGDSESTLHLMNVMGPAERTYSHPLNVAILSMLIGREAKCQAADLVALGMGTLFHDIGKARLERKLLRKRSGLSKAEQMLVEMHPRYGAEILAKIPSFPQRSLAVVLQHHERVDGSGYPQHINGDRIDILARIAAIADVYDNHCNHPDPAESLTPYLALSWMFAQQKDQLDKNLLALFIRCLGVYPPGTVVQLSSGAIGMVMAVNPENQLCPSLVLYDPLIPKKEALIVDLADETDLRIEKSIRPAHLPAAIFEYLSPRTRITYFVEPGGR